jgi:lipid-binding SYLF domain-containing protein
MAYRPRVFMTGILLLLGFAGRAMVSIVNGEEVKRKEVDEAVDKAREATAAFSEIMNAPDNAIPRKLLDLAEAVAVFPGVLKAAFVIGGSGGRGVISRRTSEGWSFPAFFKLGGSSLGAQIGAQTTDYVLLFMNDQALKGLLTDKFEMSGEASTAAGPVGRTAAATTDLKLNAQILTYSRTQGVFAGVALKGVLITPDDERNQAIYQMKARDMLLSTPERTPPGPPTLVKSAELQVFPQTLAHYLSRKK